TSMNFAKVIAAETAIRRRRSSTSSGRRHGWMGFVASVIAILSCADGPGHVCAWRHTNDGTAFVICGHRVNVSCWHSPTGNAARTGIARAASKYGRIVAVAKNNRHNAAFVVGSVLGAVVGAGAALWKTPYTGQELREKLAGGQKDSSGTNTAAARPADSGVSATSMSATSATASERSIKDKVLSSVEKTLAPIVGVELGKTASGSDATVVKAPNIKVNTGVSSDGVGQGESVAPDGSLGLSRDRVDANEWAAAYSGGAGTATQEQPASTTEATSPSSETKAEQEGGLLRHPHRWRGYDESSSGDATAGSTKEDGTIGLSQDRVDADKWAAAYSGGTGASETSAESTESTQSTQTQAAAAPAESTTEFSKTLVGQSRDQRNAARWAAA